MKVKISIPLLFLLIISSLFVLESCEQETYAHGKRLYEAQCNNCHMEDGVGLAKLIPPLAKSDWLKNNQDKVACIFRYGQKGEVVVNGVTYNQEMPGQKYTEVQITNIINYINNSWGNDFGVVTLKESTVALRNCK